MLLKRLPFLLLAISVSARAQTQPLRLTLGDAIRRALGTGTQAELARSNEELARIARSEALNALLPQADARLMRYNQSINLATFGFTLPGFPPVVGPFNVTDAQLAAAVQVFNMAALRRYQSLQSSANATQYQSEQAENDVAAAVARLYLMVQRAQTQIAARQADIALFTRLLQTAQDEFKAGTGTRLDVAQANVQLARARQALLVAQNDRQNAALALLNAVGADESSDVVIADAADRSDDPFPRSIPRSPRPRTQRPELRQAEENERAAKLTVDAARARLLPSVSLDFEGDMSGNHTNDLHWTRRIAANLGVPLFHADINANIARAKVMLHDAQTRRTQLERDVEQDVRRSLMTLQNAESRVGRGDGKRAGCRGGADGGERPESGGIRIAGRSRSRAGRVSAGARGSDRRAGRRRRRAVRLRACHRRDPRLLRKRRHAIERSGGKCSGRASDAEWGHTFGSAERAGSESAADPARKRGHGAASSRPVMPPTKPPGVQP